MRQPIFLLVFAIFGFCALGIAQSKAPEAYSETYRPLFHFTPAKNWMNDPNGPVLYKREYHLFYQYNPFGDEWGHMSWGHAVSPDMVHWRQLPVALPEENGVMIFSGSTIVDGHNTSGFCREQSCLISIYTGYTGKLQTQNIAYSNDNGRTWTKYPGNPVIDLHLQNFRDPKVFWHEPSHKWIMVVSLADQHKVRLLSSPDLKHWTALSDFGPAGAIGGVWECPDLFQLPIEGEAGQTRWVLSVNLNPGGIAGGSGDQYFVGQFDGSTFTPANPTSPALWADYGRDFYASTSFSDIPPSDGRRIWLGWLDNWDYAAKLPTHPWRGFQSVPRALSLKRFPDGIRLIQQPIADGLIVRQGSKQETVIGMNKENSKLFVDRSNAGDSSFAANFSGRQAGPIHLSNGNTAKVHVFVDRSSVEVFGNDGETVISDLIFPSSSSQDLELYSKGHAARVVKLDIWKIKTEAQ